MKTGLAPLEVTLRDVGFLHWPVPKAVVADLVPNWLQPDAADGSAWVSAIPLEMRRFDLLGQPVREHVDAVTVRTYVRGPDGDRGVYFLSLDATDRRAVRAARQLFRLPYYAADIQRSSAGAETTVRSSRVEDSRATLGVTYEPSGPGQRAAPDTLASFLVERYRYFTEGPLGTRLVGSVGHDAWTLQSATVTMQDDGLVRAFGIDSVQEEPLAHYSEGTAMRLGVPMPLSIAD